jgi:hypothetical protein
MAPARTAALAAFLHAAGPTRPALIDINQISAVLPSMVRHVGGLRLLWKFALAIALFAAALRIPMARSITAICRLSRSGERVR